MKLFNYILMAGAVATAFASCSREEDDLFSESASKRVDNNVIAYTELLESSSEGWVLNYYAGTDEVVYAGIVHTMRFKDGVVAVCSQAATDPTAECSSLYQVKAEQEAMLTFDTYNELLHYWSEPKGSSSVNGYKGDYEFTFKRISADQDTIVLKGKRYGRYCELIRLKESSADYMTKVAAIDAKLSEYPHPQAVIGTDSIDACFDSGIFTYTPEGSEESVDIPYVPTENGLRLYKEVTVGGKSFRECTLDTTNFVFSPVGAADILFPIIYPEGYASYDELIGTYTTVTNSKNVTFTVKAKEQGSSYTLSGFTYCGQDIEATYSKKTGSFVIAGAQYTGMYGSTYYCYLCVFDGSYLSWDSSLSIIGKNSQTDGQLTITFSGNGNDYPSLIEYAFSSQSLSSNSTVGYIRMYNVPLVFKKQ